MKKEKIIEKIKFHHETKFYTKITREIAKGIFLFSYGYILDYSDDLILLHETDDFSLIGYNILPINQISKLRFNKWDKYYDKIMRWENQLEHLGINYPVVLNSWQSVFKSINEQALNVIVECENTEEERFLIGPITAIKKKKVAILNYDPAGFFDDDPTLIYYNLITKVQFDERYSKIFGKYTRHRKVK